MTYTSCGKQVLRNGQHFADACSNDAAETIVRALQDNYDDEPVLSFDWMQQQRHTPRREGDEYVCNCGVRYDVREDHP